MGINRLKSHNSVFYYCSIYTLLFKDDLYKKSRSSNFTREEELLLVDEVRKVKHVIECKASNKVRIKKKEEAWKNVHQSFQSRTTTTRTIEQLKSKYDNLKTKAGKDVANNKTVFKKLVEGHQTIRQTMA